MKILRGILAYCSILGWLIAFFLGDKNEVKSHLNQGLVLSIASLINSVIGFIPVIGGISGIIGWVIGAFSLVGIIFAIIGKDELPIIGSIKILK